MRPVPLAVDLAVVQTGSPWPPVGGSPEVLASLNTALAVRLGRTGWAFDWESRTENSGWWRVPAVLESLAVRSYPSGSDPAPARLEARALVRSVVVPVPGERGDLGSRIAGRLDGVVWRYTVGRAEGAALLSVEGVRVCDPLRESVRLYERRCDLSAVA